MKMRRRFVLWGTVSLVWAAALLAQQTPSAPPPSAQSSQPSSPTLEFPVTFTQDVAAGKTAVGTKVEAKLVVSTLLAGKVIPRNATLAGEVTESIAKTKTDPSRLSVRIDSIKWKDETMPVTVYVTSWFYPATQETGPDLQYGPQLPATRTWNGAGGYPSQDCKVCTPFPSGDSDDKSSSPGAPISVSSTRPVRMKDVQTDHTSSGGIELASRRSNLKLDRFTIYLLAVAEDPINAK